VLPLASASYEFYVYTICQVEIYVQNFFYFYIFSFVSSFTHDFIALILPVSQLQTEQVVTSQLSRT